MSFSSQEELFSLPMTFRYNQLRESRKQCSQTLFWILMFLFEWKNSNRICISDFPFDLIVRINRYILDIHTRTLQLSQWQKNRSMMTSRRNVKDKRSWFVWLFFTKSETVSHSNFFKFQPISEYLQQTNSFPFNLYNFLVLNIFC